MWTIQMLRQAGFMLVSSLGNITQPVWMRRLETGMDVITTDKVKESLEEQLRSAHVR